MYTKTCIKRSIVTAIVVHSFLVLAFWAMSFGPRPIEFIVPGIFFLAISVVLGGYTGLLVSTYLYGRSWVAIVLTTVTPIMTLVLAIRLEKLYEGYLSLYGYISIYVLICVTELLLASALVFIVKLATKTAHRLTHG